MKISLRYDVVKNQKPIQNGCPPHLLDFAYSLIVSPRGDENWDLFSALPTRHSNLQNILSNCGINNIIEEHIDTPIIDTQTTMYIIAPLGDARNYLGINPHDNPSFIDFMSKKAKELIKNRTMKLIIDYSAEGYSIERVHISELHTLLDNEKIPLDNVYFISSNLLLEKIYQNWCKMNNITPMNIIIGPFFEYFSFNIYRHRQDDKHVFQQLDTIKKKPRAKKFLCFNRRPHPHRHALVCLLSMEKLLDNSFVSWPANIDHSFENKENFLWSTFNDVFPPNHPLYNRLIIESKKLEEISPLIVDQTNFLENFAYGYENATHYQDSYFSIVTETLFHEPSVIFFSEKIWKPIANLHPFLLVATKGSLSKLRELGYKTFSPYINESYDLIDHNADRMLAIVEEMKRLNNMPIDDLNNMYYDDILPILIHNRNWFFANQIQHISIPLEKITN